MRKLFRNRAVGAALVVFALVVAACGSGDDSTDTTAAATQAPGTDAPSTEAPPTEAPGTEAPAIPEGPTIIVGSTNFGEQLILGDIYATVLEQAGYPVERSFNLGSREVVNPALKSGEIGMPLVVDFESLTDEIRAPVFRPR